jgi:hypothetical protein
MRAPYLKAFVYLALCATLTDCVPAENAFSDVPILNCSGLPCVQARLEGGPPIRLLLDFSSLASYVSRSAVRNQHLGISSRAQMGSVVLKDRFVVVDPTSEESLTQIGRNEFPGGDGGLSLRAFADRLLFSIWRIGGFVFGTEIPRSPSAQATAASWCSHAKATSFQSRSGRRTAFR